MPEDQPKPEKQPEEIKLDRKSKILFAVLAILIVGSVAMTFWRYMVKNDYIIESQIDCDPETENCFIWKCDPMSLEEGEACTGIPDNDTWYYKILQKNAKNIPLCDPSDENCDALACPEGEKDCQEILCTNEDAAKGEKCSNPEQYLLENPPTDEECAEGDEECLSSEEETACEEGDTECESAAESEECAPDDEECLNQANKEDTQESDNVPAAEESTDQTVPQKNVIPPGVQPM